jgi:hypothetical protein
LEIDWGKNSFFRNHSKLFLKSDIAPAVYYYAEGHEETQPAYVRSLRSVVKRLELLGYTLANCRHCYGEAVQQVPDHYPNVETSFDAFMRAMRSVDVTRVSLPDDDPSHYDLGELACAILADPEFATLVDTLSSTITRDEGTFFENLDPYIALRLLAENPRNLDQDVVWRFQDVLEGGYVEQNSLYEGPADADRYLIVTEGSSDSSILHASLPLVEPDVADFFHFVDMKENYPFTGTGNLVNFCKGLAAIKVTNKIVVLLDNDTAGHEALQRLRALALPGTMRITVLPQLDELKHFATLGPTGRAVEDINGRAVAIECFLDFTSCPEQTPAVRWTSFNASRGAYQGELVNKDAYTRAFFIAARRGTYDFRKLGILWSHILRVCAS